MNGLCNPHGGHHFQPGFNRCDCGHWTITYSVTVATDSLLHKKCEHEPEMQFYKPIRAGELLTFGPPVCKHCSKILIAKWEEAD